jgi:hypothetical protein
MYHQIKMKVKGQEKTSFITPYSAFCYVTIPFGLKNAGATLFNNLAYLAWLK